MIGLIHLCILSQNKAYSLRYFESSLYLSTLNLNWITIRFVSHEHCSSCSKRNVHYFSLIMLWCLQKIGLIPTVKSMSVIWDRDKWAMMMKWVTVLQRSVWWKWNIILKVLFFKQVSCPACMCTPNDLLTSTMHLFWTNSWMNPSIYIIC